MTPLVFYVLLTLNFESGTKDQPDFATWKRVQVLRSDPAPDFESCERGKPNVLTRVQSVWDMLAERAEPTYRVANIQGVCIGMKPTDIVPADTEKAKAQ